MTPAEDPAQPPDEVAPHTPLTDYYSDTDQRHEYVMDLFDRTAKHYDTVERIFGNGGLWYRRFSMKRAGVAPGMRVLDIATGTGAVFCGAAELVGPSGRVFGVDPNREMLREARKKHDGPLSRGVGQALPFRSNEFDFVTMGIALRHVSDLVAAFREYHRVLKPGGRVWILEAHVPESQLGRTLTRLTWAKLIPGLTLAFTRSREAKELMDYYWDTVDQCVPRATIVDAMTKAGFDGATCKTVIPGAFCEYTARKLESEG